MAHNRSIPVLTAAATVAVLLPFWLLTRDPNDAKLAAGLVVLPVLAVIAMRKPPGNALDERSFGTLTRLLPIVVVCFLMYNLVNWHARSYPYYGHRTLAFVWLNLLAFVAGAIAFSRERIYRAAISGLVIACVAASIWSFLEYLALVPYFRPSSWPPRVSGLMGHKNTLGLLLIGGLMWSAQGFLTARANRMKAAWFAAAAIQLAALGISDSRGSLLLAVVGLAAALLPNMRRYLARLQSRLLLYGLLLGLLSIPILLWSEGTWVRFARLLDPAGHQTMRFGYYVAQWRVFLEYPFFGAGLGNFVHVNVAHWPEWLREIMDPYTLPRNGHCEYLEVLCELGIVGLGFHLFFWVGALWLGIRELRHRFKRETWISVCLLGVILLHASFSTASRRIPAALMMWLTMAWLWRTAGAGAWRRVNARATRLVTFGTIAAHVVVSAFLLQVFAGDALFNRAVDKRHHKKPSGALLMQALRVCPYHPETLYQTAYLSSDTKQYDYARKLVDALDATAPHYRPTDFIRSWSFYMEKQYDSSLVYARKAVAAKPKHYEARVIFAGALMRTGHCTELDSLTRHEAVTLKRLDKRLESAGRHEPGDAKYRQRYVQRTGAARAALGRRFLFPAYVRSLAIRTSRLEKERRHTAVIVSLSCADAPDSVSTAAATPSDSGRLLHSEYAPVPPAGR